MTNLEYCNEILSIIGNVTEANDAIYNLAFDAYQKLGGQESQPSLATIYNELKSAIQIWDNTDSLNITENGTYNLLGKIITVNVQCSGSIPANSEIWYTSVDDNIIEEFNTNFVGANLVSNIYENGKGIAKYDGDVLGWHNVGTVGGPLSNNKMIKTIILPDSVSKFSVKTFGSCSNLISISIPAGLTTWDRMAGYNASYTFSGCSSLTDITYRGTIEQWKAIDKGRWWNQGVPATVVHCTDGDTPI